MTKPLTPAETQALNILRQAMKDNFKRTFQGATFATKADQLAQGAGAATDAVVEIVDSVCGEIVSIQGYENFKKGFSAVAQPGPFVMSVLKKLTGMDSSGEILTAIGPHTLAGFFEAIAPFYGVIGSSVEAVKHFYKAVDDLVKSWAGAEALPAVQTGAPAQALTSVATLLKRRSNDNFAQGAVKSVESIVNGALIGTGYGGVATAGVSLGAKVATLAVIIRRRVLEYREVQKGKMALGNAAELTPKVFETCPLMGCYLLTNSDTSSIVMSCFAQGTITADWKKEVEKNKRQIDPLIDAAREFIGDSLFELKGPGITTRATASDKRPWIERFWIARFGATGKGYRVITTGKKVVEKASLVKDVATDTLRTGYKKALELLLQGKGGE
ncbi:MAG: hypothetical protein U1F60_13970 [Planctomycetota bacterium]